MKIVQNYAVYGEGRSRQLWEFFLCHIQYGCVRAVICKPAAAMKWAVYQVTIFFVSGWTGSLATGEFAFQFSSPKLPLWCRHGSVNVSLSIWCTELIYISLISRKTCLIMTINFSFPFVLFLAHGISYT